MAKIILVTGGNRGIGLEIVRQLARAGHTVILAARQKSNGLSAIRKLNEEGLKVHFTQLDVTSRKDISNSVAWIKNELGRLDVLINNAAIMPASHEPLFPVDEKKLAEVMNTNAWGPLFLAESVAGLMPRGGRIINISSDGGSMTDPVGGWAPLYCISKTTLNAITRHAQYYLQARGISVHAMCPGWVKTEMGGKQAPREIEHGAETAVWLATTGHIPGGKFWRDKKEIPW